MLNTNQHLELEKQKLFAKSIAEKIAVLLKERGLTQKDLAKILGKTDAEVSRWLSGNHNLTLSTLAKISVALGVDLISSEKKKPKPYEPFKEKILNVAEPVASYGSDMNALKVELIGEIMSLDNLQLMKRIASLIHRMKGTSSIKEYTISPEIIELAGDRVDMDPEYEKLLQEKKEEKFL